MWHLGLYYIVMKSGASLPFFFYINYIYLRRKVENVIMHRHLINVVRYKMMFTKWDKIHKSCRKLMFHVLISTSVSFLQLC